MHRAGTFAGEGRYIASVKPITLEPMYCDEFLSRYSEYDDSLLTPAEEAEFRRHLESCDECRRYDRVLRKGRMLARQIPRPEPSQDFLPRLHVRIQDLRGSRGVRAPRLPAALAAVTVLVVAASGLMLLRTMPPAATTVADVETEVAPAAMMEPAAVPGTALPTRGPDGRALALPPTVSLDLMDWTVGGVDPRQVASYSPFVTGPPAFRANRGWSYRSTNPTLRALD